MVKPLLTLENLVVAFADKEILNIPRFDFMEGSIYGIIGPSGAGKSTLLRVVNILQQPTAGTVFFDGMPQVYKGNQRLKIQRQMSMVFQKPVLFSGTVLENVLYGLKIRGYTGSQTRQEGLEALKLVGMESFAGAQARTLSGGESQRVALARAVIIKPRLLLLDEPTANLDPANVVIIEKIISKINKDLGTTVIMVTHNLFQAKRVANETIFMNQGRIVENNQTCKIFENPHNSLTKEFLQGDMVY